MKIELVNLKRNYTRHQKEIDGAITRVLDSGVYILGDEVESFEREFAQFCEAKYCVSVASGTDALFLSLKALGISQGDEVITVSNSFVSTATTISALGAVPVFADVDARTFTIDVADVEKEITSRTKAILPVHLYGQPADMSSLKTIAQKYGLKILEDACQAHGARYRGERVGTLGDIAAFSFYPSKNLGGYGDGGAVVTNDKTLAEKILRYRTYGGKVKDHYVTDGINSRLDALQAAVLRVKLRHLEKGNEERRKHALRYHALLSGTDIILPETVRGTESASHLFVIRSKKRDALAAHLKQYGISTGVHYPVPIHLQPIYQKLGYIKGSVPITEMLAEEILSLPLCPELEENEIAYVAERIKNFLQ